MVRYSRVSLIGLANGAPPGLLPSSPKPKTCVCPSMSPGNTVALLRSISCAPCGTATLSAEPTDLIFSPSIRIIWFSNIFPDLLSNKWPARMATVVFWAFAENAATRSSQNVVSRNFQEVNYVLRAAVSVSTNRLCLLAKARGPGSRSEPLSSPDRNLLNFVDQNLGRDRVMLRHSNKVTLQLRHQASCAASRT